MTWLLRLMYDKKRYLRENSMLICLQVLHATPKLVDTLTKCRTLLKPDGYLFMQELCTSMLT